MNKDFDDEVAKDLKTVADYFYKEDNDTRQIQIRHWQRLKYYWNNLSLIYWNDRAGEYRVFGRNDFASDADDQISYDKPVNVFKAFLETIIAALSVNVPAVSCIPDDAQNPLDISTAKAGTKISELIYKHNDVILLWLQALYIYCTEGLVACYSHPIEDKKFGVYKENKYKMEETEGYQCPHCDEELDEDTVIDAKLLEEATNCPKCGDAIDPLIQKTKFKVKRFDKETEHPKSRIKLEVYGGLYVKVANYAKAQEGTPYLIFAHETHYVNALEEYPELKDKLPQGGWSNQGVNEDYEQYARLNVQYRGTYPQDVVTVKKVWLRPSAFHILPEEKCEKYRKLFPDGVKVCLVNELVADYYEESLDDVWTLTQNPLSDYLNHEPLGEVLTNIQDIINDLISLTLQLIEHGVPETWVDPAVVNIPQYGQKEIVPGTLNATKPVSGNRRVSEAFHSTSTSSVSPEIFTFYRIVNELAQFVSGALPSIFGGAQPGGGDTASEYAMSKGMALQRLQTPWKMLTIWWKGIFGKAIPQYMNLMMEDERLVEKDKSGNYVNVFIRKAELEGKIGDIELENSDQLPITDDQQKQVIMELMSLNNMEVFNALIAPENLPFVRKLVRIPQFKLPGEDDRQKQYEEINELLNGVPIPIPQDPAIMMEAQLSNAEVPSIIGEEPSVQIDVDIDNHQIEAEICRNWLVSEPGRFIKKENPDGYKNVLLHFKAHRDQVTKQMQMDNMMNTQVEETPAGEPKGSKQKGPEKITAQEKANAPIS